MFNKCIKEIVDKLLTKLDKNLKVNFFLFLVIYEN